MAVLTLIKNISLVLRLCIFRDLIYAQSGCNTPKRKENLKLYHMTPLTRRHAQRNFRMELVLILAYARIIIIKKSLSGGSN